tara:strand:- start:83 stop:430 length:348 start_codon:yes stop_codon:yes gene_type:complete
MKTLLRRCDSTEIEAPEDQSYEGHWLADTNKTVFVFFDFDPYSEQCGWNFWTAPDNTIWGTWDSKTVCEKNATEWYTNPEHATKLSEAFEKHEKFAEQQMFYKSNQKSKRQRKEK